VFEVPNEDEEATTIGGETEKGEGGKKNKKPDINELKNKFLKKK